MKFVEMRAFSRAVHELLTPEEYRELQNALQRGETRIDTIRGTGGLKKARWGSEGRGRRGGLRVIYYECVELDIYLMLAIYSKSRRDDLSTEEKKTLKALVEELIERYCHGEGTV